MNVAPYHDVFAALAAVISTISVAVSSVAVARINATKTEVGEAKTQAAEANVAATDARNGALTSNGCAHESRETWARIEQKLTELAQRQIKTNAWLTKHLSDHAESDIKSQKDT